jgi:glycosyltransferase involved in cell wall biosynthesis
MISVLILTYNEEENLPHCLDALSWSDDVVVYDSFSTDRTVAVARARGARVFQRAFNGYGEQREAARGEVPYKYAWVLAVDADEEPDAELVGELRQIALRDDGPPHAYRMRRKDQFWGRWIPHATLYPSWFVRFYRHRNIRYEPRSVHEYPVVEGPVGELRGHLIHHSFRKGLGDWLRKHVRYAELEAQENLRSIEQGLSLRALFSADPIRRRRALKELSFWMPFRPALRFLYMYVLRRGFLDGWAGYTYCRLLATYEYLITLEMKAARRRGRGLAL